MRRRLTVLVVTVCALAFGAAGTHAAAGSKPIGGAEVAALLRGIPQHGVALGSPKAPVTLVEFADLQCPYCAEWERNTLPAIVKHYVRPGKVRIVFTGMTFVGPDSTRLFRAALSAGLQNRLWNVVELLYLNQGPENTGWATDAFLRSVGKSVKGLNVAKMLAKRSSAAVRSKAAAAAAFTSSAHIQGTPSFAVGRTNSSLQLIQVTSLDASGIEPTLDAVLRG